MRWAFVVRYAPDTVYWQRHYLVEPTKGLAWDDSTIWVPGYWMDESTPAVLMLDHDGDSLRTVPVDQQWIRGIADAANGAVVFGMNGLLRMAADGSVIASSPVAAKAALELPDGHVITATPDSILLLDPSLQLTGVGVPYEVEPGEAPTLLLHGSDLLVVTTTAVSRFGPGLVPGGLVPFGHPDGYFAPNAALHDDLLMTAGSYTSGATGAAWRAWSLAGNAPLQVDVGLYDLLVDSSNVHQINTPNGPHLVGHFWVNGLLVNHGEVALDHAMIDQILPYGICSAAGYQHAHSGLGLAPGDSVRVTTGPFAWDGPYIESAPATREFCIWVSCPDERMDRDRSNNEACVDVHVPVGIAEHDQAAPPNVYPNPTTDRITVDLARYAGVPMTLAWLDLTGRVVQQVEPLVGGTLLDLPMDPLPPGAYLLRIGSSARQWTVRVVRL